MPLLLELLMGNLGEHNNPLMLNFLGGNNHNHMFLEDHVSLATIVVYKGILKLIVESGLMTLNPKNINL